MPPEGKTLVVTPSRCTSCRTCELACAFRHADGGDLGVARIKAFLVGDTRNQILTCFQCDQAARVAVCPVAALTRDPVADAIAVDEDRCIGCALCTVACPFGHIVIDKRAGVAVKCDLCGGREPACAAFCPTKTLEYM